MDALEAGIRDATANGVLPAVLIAVASRDGSLDYFHCFGRNRLEESAPLASSESVVCLASATKLVTCVAVMQLVERGHLELDDDVAKTLPEWHNAKILKGFDKNNEGKPILEKAQNAMKIRHLLTHTSGITGLEEEQLMEYYRAIGDKRGTLFERYFLSDDSEEKSKALPEVHQLMGSLDVHPLLFEPGTKWAYGQSTDWAGQIVERVTGLDLETYCRRNIFEPLGMASTTYRLLEHPEIHRNLIQMTSRRQDGSIEHCQSVYPIDPKQDLGGSNLYTSAPDYLKLLSSLLRDDGKILSPQTADKMFSYRLPETDAFRQFKTDQDMVQDYFPGMAPEGMEVDHCLAGLINMRDLKEGRKAESVTWQGATCCYWWIDRKAGLCGFYGSQIMNLGDQKTSRGFFHKLESTVYGQYAS